MKTLLAGVGMAALLAGAASAAPVTPSGLPAASTLTGPEVVFCDQLTGSVLATKGCTAAQIAALAQATSLQKSANLGDLLSPSAARTALGVTATGSDTTYLYRSNNFSDIANLATALSNLRGAAFSATNAGLTGQPASAYPNGVLRGDTTAGYGDRPIVLFPTGSPCGLNSGAGDTGSQVEGSDGNCLVSYQHRFDLLDFNAKCDGTTDDTTAVQNWLNKLASGVTLTAPSLTCKITSPLTTPAAAITYASIVADNLTLSYAGSSTTPDILLVGDGTHAVVGLNMSGIRVTSTTQMTAGSGIHFRLLERSYLSNLTGDGQDGSGKLWNALNFDQIDEVFVNACQARGQNDAVDVSGTVGSGPKAGLFLGHCKISMSGVGVHVAGAFGGLALNGTDVIDNGVNLLIDDALKSEGNREIFVDASSSIDTTTSGNGVTVNDPLASGGDIDIAGWVATSAAIGIDVKSWPNGIVHVRGSRVYNNTSDGVKDEDATTTIAFSPSLSVVTNGGIGVNCSVSTALLSGFPFISSNTGGAYSSNCHWPTAAPGDVRIFGVSGVQSNTSGDVATITIPPAITKYRVNGVFAMDAASTPASAVVNVWTGAGGTGTEAGNCTSTQLQTLTSSSLLVGCNNNALSNVLTSSTLKVNVATPNGSNDTVSIFVQLLDLSAF